MMAKAEPDPVERRATDRVSMNLATSCRVPATPHRVTVLDLSHSGCRVSFDHANIPSGSTVHLDLKPASSVTGQVVWVDARAAGIQFEKRFRSELAVDLGIEQAPVEETPEEIVEAPAGVSGLQHWVRRIFEFQRR